MLLPFSQLRPLAPHCPAPATAFPSGYIARARTHTCIFFSLQCIAQLFKALHEMGRGDDNEAPGPGRSGAIPLLFLGIRNVSGKKRKRRKKEGGVGGREERALSSRLHHYPVPSRPALPSPPPYFSVPSYSRDKMSALKVERSTSGTLPPSTVDSI
jgi:hypothetical protein